MPSNTINRSQAGLSRLAPFVLALLYLAFVVYGSLVPLDYRPVPATEAWTRFENIRYLNLGIGSRADWVANILLFIPLTFLWLGVIGPRGMLARAVAALFVTGCAIVLSVGVEFVQIYFPPRTVSLNDILAESLGALAGVLFWLAWGIPLARWVRGWKSAKGTIATTERVLYLYLFVLFAYNVLPLDLTISPVEIFHKWSERRIFLVPFSFPRLGPIQIAYELIADVAIWIPAGLLWRKSANLSPAQAFNRIIFAALLLEFLQLFVYSRVSDITDIITAMTGAVIANAIFDWRGAQIILVNTDNPALQRTRSSWVVLWFVLMIFWLLAIATVFWFPFNFRIERAFIAERLAFMDRVPFQIYYYGTEFRAITEVIHKIAFFAPGGALLAYGTSRIRAPLGRHLFGFGAIAFIAGAALAIELGQVLLPEKHPDMTDWVLESAGGWLGYAGYRFLVRGSVGSRLRQR